jgi:hypothetical protein
MAHGVILADASGFGPGLSILSLPSAAKNLLQSQRGLQPLRMTDACAIPDYFPSFFILSSRALASLATVVPG